MKPILYEKDKDIVAFLKKQMSSREVPYVVDLSQFKVNRIMKKYFENIIMTRRSYPQALTTLEENDMQCV
jgi:DNA-directed RNA polymerase specialized sigma subunit